MSYILKITPYNNSGTAFLEAEASEIFNLARQLTETIKRIRIDIMYSDVPDRIRATFYSREP